MVCFQQMFSEKSGRLKTNRAITICHLFINRCAPDCTRIGLWQLLLWKIKLNLALLKSQAPQFQVYVHCSWRLTLGLVGWVVNSLDRSWPIGSRGVPENWYNVPGATARAVWRTLDSPMAKTTGGLDRLIEKVWLTMPVKIWQHLWKWVYAPVKDNCCTSCMCELPWFALMMLQQHIWGLLWHSDNGLSENPKTFLYLLLVSNGVPTQCKELLT